MQKNNFFWNPNYLRVDVLAFVSGVTSVLYSQKAEFMTAITYLSF